MAIAAWAAGASEKVLPFRVEAQRRSVQDLEHAFHLTLCEEGHYGIGDKFFIYEELGAYKAAGGVEQVRDADAPDVPGPPSPAMPSPKRRLDC